jgi:FlaA1/EpsC-like NDP-sugar epimerase
MQMSTRVQTASEPEDIFSLLGRLPIAVNRDLLCDAVAGRTILVTGAGGTIGGELARQLLSLGVARLVLLDHTEHALFWIDHELSETAPANAAIEPILGSICDRALIDKLLESCRPDIVFHAAACKHVAMVESNPIAGIHTNVLGTHNLLESCKYNGVERFLLISSDKAENPTSLMGRTKRCAELLTYAAAGPGEMYASVRFGNVLGSSGSVVRIFEKQIARGRALEIRHRDAVRYFMSKEEAGRLLLLGSSMVRGGEIYVLETGELVRILDLAHRMVLRSGKTVRMPGESDGDIGIRFTELQDGEKLVEELYGMSVACPTRFPCVSKVDEAPLPNHRIEALIEGLKIACRDRRVDAASESLDDIIDLSRIARNG